MASLIRRQIACNLSVNLRGRLTVPSSIISVDYRLEIPALGFEMSIGALIDETMITNAPDTEEALLKAGYAAFAMHLKGNLPPSLSPAYLSRREDRPSDLDPDFPPPLNLSRKDQEVLRGLGISPD